VQSSSASVSSNGSQYQTYLWCPTYASNLVKKLTVPYILINSWIRLTFKAEIVQNDIRSIKCLHNKANLQWQLNRSESPNLHTKMCWQFDTVIEYPELLHAAGTKNNSVKVFSNVQKPTNLPPFFHKPTTGLGPPQAKTKTSHCYKRNSRKLIIK